MPDEIIIVSTTEDEETLARAFEAPAQTPAPSAPVTQEGQAGQQTTASPQASEAAPAAGEAAEAETAEPQEAPTPEEKLARGIKRLQSRVSKLTKEIAQAREEKSALEAERARLEGELRALRDELARQAAAQTAAVQTPTAPAGQAATASPVAQSGRHDRDGVTPTAAPPSVEPTPTPAAPTEPAPAPKPKIEDFATDAEYLEALAAWAAAEQARKLAAEQAEAARRAAQEILEQELRRQAQLAAWAARVAEAKARYQDFDEVVQPFLATKTSPILQDAVLNRPDGPALLYYLARHPDEHEAIIRKPAAEQLIAIGEIAATIRAETGQSRPTEPAAPPPKAAPSAAPAAPAPPPPPVISGSKAAASIRPDEMDFQSYKRWRESQSR